MEKAPGGKLARYDTDDPDELPKPEDLVGEAMTQLETALDALNELAAQLSNGKNEE